MIKDIRAIPVFRLLTGLLWGILLKKYFNINHHILITVLLFLIVLSVLMELFGLIRKPGHEWLNGISILLFYIIFGYLVRSITSDKKGITAGNIRGTYIAEVLSTPVESENYTRIQVEILKSSYTTDNVAAGGRVLVYFKISDILPDPGLSDLIIFSGELRIPDPPENPGEFNYAAYLRSRGIIFTSFLKAEDWRIIGKNERFCLSTFALHLRQKLWKRISAVEPGNPNLDILYALALGSKDLLDKETRESFAATGAMHVLAVSGLHVGLIWMVISKLLILLRKLPSGNFLFFASVFLILWMYALVTGMSPSVVRSTIMFSFVNLGKTIQKETSVYNSVFLAAFISILFVPGWLYDPGFQLSYCAVLGIVFFQPKISALFSSRFRITQWAWEITSVSIAAQIGTISISLFYFQRFPPYFLITNLIVIPMVTIILAAFIFLVSFMFIPYVFFYLSKIVFFLVGMLNYSVKAIENLPSPGFNNIFIDREQMWLLVLIVLFTAFYFRYRHNYWLIANILCIILFQYFETMRIWKRNHSEHIVVYRISQDYVVGMYSSGKGIILVSTEDTEGIADRIKYKCSGFHRKYSIVSPEIVFIKSLNYYGGDLIHAVKIPGDQNYFCWFMDKRILLLNDPSYYNNRKSCKFIEADILILGGKRKIRKDALSNNFLSKLIIFSGSIPYYIAYEDYSGNSSESEPIIFDTRESGAWLNSRIIENQLLTRIENYLKSLGNL